MIFLARAAAVCALAGVCFGASTKVWETSEYADFVVGDLNDVSLSREGQLTLAPAAEELAKVDDPVVWGAAQGGDGALYFGTGHAGKLYRANGGGAPELVWKAPEVEIFAVTVGPGKDLFVGTAPDGKVYRVTPKGEAKEFFKPEAKYIWSLAYDAASKTLYVGTGHEGKVFKVDGSGKGAVWFESGQRHVIDLTLDREGRLLVGTDPNGALYRVDKAGKAFALYDSDLPEIRSIRQGPDGDLFFLGLGGAFSLADKTVQAVGAATTISVTATGGWPGATPGAGLTPSVIAPPSPSAVSTPVVINYGVETSAVYRLRPEGAVDKLWTSTDENALTLAADPREPGRWVFATDSSGHIYSVDADGDVRLVREADEQQGTSLIRRDGDLLLTTAHSGTVYQLSDSAATEGTYETTVRDAGGAARWGRLSWRGAGPVSFQTRSGNSARPDATWSEWSEAIEGPDGGPVASPPARYLQWRATLRRDGDAAPSIDRVRVTYLPFNRPPTISSVKVAEEEGTASSSSGASPTSSSAASTAAYSVTVSASGPGGTGVSTGRNDQAARKSNNGSKVAISWEATDPDGDDLQATVEFRGEGETSWKVLKKDLTEKKLTIDSEALADGRYWFRVRLTDAPSNPPDEAREAQKVSQPIVADHTPPQVRAVEASREQARFEATDGASMIAAAEYSIDAGPWTPVRPDDGIPDSLAESFTIPLTDLEPGERLLTLRVRDRAGNAGLAKTVIR